MSFRLEDKVPEIYVEKSRDFQLLCRILDIFLGSCQEKVQKIHGNWSVDTVDESLLPLLVRRLGFTDRGYIPPNILRNICRSYPKIIRNKGTLQAVREAAYAVLSANQEVTALEVSATNKDSTGVDVYSIALVSNVASGDEQYLERLLPSILPAGMAYKLILNVVASYATETKIKPATQIIRVRGRGASISKIVGAKPGDNEFVPKPDDEGTGEWDIVPEGIDHKEHPEMVKVYSRVNVGLVVGNKFIEKSFAIQDKSLESNVQKKTGDTNI